MKKIVMLLILTATSFNAVAQEHSVRESLQMVSPAILEVVEEMEAESGRQFTDDQLPALLKSEKYLRRFEDKARQDPMYSPCRLEHCVRT